MIFALAKVSALIEKFNRRSLTERDFFRLCKKFNIKTHFQKLPVLQGFHVKIEKEMCIFLDKNLTGAHFLYIAFHELAHCLLHESVEPVQINFYNQFDTREENEAEAVALVALYPTKVVRNLENELIYADEFTAFLIKKRLAIFKETGI